MRSALFAHLDRDYAGTEEFLSDAVRADSDSIDSYLALARFYRDRGEVGRAIGSPVDVHDSHVLDDAVAIVCRVRESDAGEVTSTVPDLKILLARSCFWSSVA